ncbi:MAG: hypothetical protein ACREIA_16780 [Opitutaceae bacterium]
MDDPAPPTPPSDESGQAPHAEKDNTWSGLEYTLGLLLTIPAILLGMALFDEPGLFLGFALVLGIGMWLGLAKRRWAAFAGTLTCIIAVPLILFVICTINPPDFH